MMSVHRKMVREAKEKLKESRTKRSLLGEKKRLSVLAAINEFSLMSFDWGGERDCCVFVSRLIQEIHGFSPIENFDYKSKSAALFVIRQHGNLVETISSVLGPARLCEDFSKVKEGDLLAVQQTDGSWIPGVSFMGRLVVRTPEGVTDWPLDYATYFWRPSLIKYKARRLMKCLKR